MRTPSITDFLSANEQLSLDSETRACLKLWAASFVAKLTAVAESRRANGYCPTDGPQHWFNCDDTHPGSFIWLCDLFNLDPDRARFAAQSRFADLLKRDKYAKRKCTQNEKGRFVSTEVRDAVEEEVPDTDGLQAAVTICGRAAANSAHVVVDSIAA